MQYSYDLFSGGGGRAANPYLDLGGLFTPSNLHTSFDICEYIWYKVGLYRTMMERVFAYFVTNIDVEDADPSEKDKYITFYRKMGILRIIFEAWMEYGCYGNVFFSAIQPFVRFLKCPNKECRFQVRLREAYFRRDVFKYAFENYGWRLQCPHCKTSGEWIVSDLPDNTENKIELKKWPCKEMWIEHDEYSGQKDYFWRIPEQYRQAVSDGKLVTIENIPLGLLKAVKNNQWYRFKPGEIYHMHEPVLTGLKTGGWAVPSTIVNIGLVSYVQTLLKGNEVLAHEFVTPTRIITPGVATGGTTKANDPLHNSNGASFVAWVNYMVARRRRRPDSVIAMPYPLQIQLFGGEAREFAPVDLIDQGLRFLSIASKSPLDLFSADLSAQWNPAGIRLFESTWTPARTAMDGFLDWFSGMTSRILRWDRVRLKLIAPTVADDLELKNILFQLMMSGDVSRTDALRQINLSWLEQFKKRQDEEMQAAELTQKMQDQLKTTDLGRMISQGATPASLGLLPGAAGPGGAPPAQGPGGPAPGGAPGTPATNPGLEAQMAGASGPMDVASMVPTNASPDELISAAESIASTLTRIGEGAPTPAQVRQTLSQIKQTNEALYAQVKSKMQEQRSAAASQGRQMVLSQPPQ